MKFQAISMREVENYLNRPHTQLVDLRTRKEYSLYHLEGAVNIPYEELGQKKREMSKDIMYVLYCERGGTSLLAAKELSQEGYRVCTVIGGIRAWEDSSFQ